jgi:apocytochrome f
MIKKLLNLNFLKNFIFSFFPIFFLNPFLTLAFPIYAQQSYENPREANGRIVCANCHLAQKPTEFESPNSVLPDTVFKTIVKVPYDLKQKQILGNGEKGGLNVGAIVILPEGFKLAPKNRLSETLKTDTKGIYITPYNSKKENILVVGPINGEKNQEIIFPLLSPDPNKEKNIYFVKYPIYVGANRGRGQVYPTGEKTNNNIFISNTTGKIESITKSSKNTEVNILNLAGNIETQEIPKGLTLIVKENEYVKKDQILTENPNVGGFGQTEVEIVLQNPLRIYGYLFFSISIIITQAMFVFKKKQFEKVQIAELDF